MANYSREERLVREIRYTLKTPSNGAELEKMLHAAARELSNGTVGALSDDALLVTTEDENIVITWTELKA